MSQVFGIDPKHVEGERRMGRAIKRIISNKVVDATGAFFFVPRGHMESLERAYDKSFPELDQRAKDFLKIAKRARRRKK